MKKLLLFAMAALFCARVFAQTLPTGFSLTDVSSGATWNKPQANWPSGVYFLSVQNRVDTKQVKFIKAQ